MFSANLNMVHAKFQFLIGTIKTRRSAKHIAVIVVSIPHRYDKNATSFACTQFFIPFQFLIGTIKTLPWSRLRCNHPQFQFLIGTIKTDCLFAEQAYMSGFQFLIGTIKTAIVGIYAVKWLKFQFLIGTIKTKSKTKKWVDSDMGFNSS